MEYITNPHLESNNISTIQLLMDNFESTGVLTW